MVKIRDVAKRAGVSPATASRALNNHPRVDPELASRVKAAAAELSYRPNVVARNLRKKSTQVASLIIPDIEDYFCTSLARGAEDIAREYGYSVLLCNSDGKLNRERAYLDVAESGQVAGILLSSRNAGIPPDITGVPVVAIDVSLGENTDSVTTDSWAGGQSASEHLLAQGWTKFACIAGPRDSPTSNARVDGFLSALKEANTPCTVIHSSYDRSGGESAMREILEKVPRPFGLLIANEKLAIGALSVLHAEQVRLGETVGAVAFDDAPWAPLLEVPLTVVDQPAYKIGTTAMRLLMDRVRHDGNSPVQHVVLPTRLIVRKSSIRQQGAKR